MIIFLFRPLGERNRVTSTSVCVSACVCVCVCLSVCLSVRSQVSRTTRPIFAKFLCLSTMAVTRPFPGGVAICHVLPVSMDDVIICTYWFIRRMSIPLQRVTSSRRRAQDNASAVSQWWRRVVDDGGCRD